MWLVSYLAILVPGAVVGEVLFGLAILALVGGGVVAGRRDEGLPGDVGSAVRGVLVGVVSALLNLLLVASLLQSDIAGGGGWVIGILIGCVVAGAVGGVIGANIRPWRTDGNWLSVFCWVTTALTLFMIVTGGIVTGFQAGLAVPDWPNSYGHNMLLYPLSEMVADLDGGVFYEHAHRLTGMFVGLTAIPFCLVLWTGSVRRWVAVLGTFVLALVVLQGVLGGLRVTGWFTMSQDAADLAPSTILAVVHGVLAQLILAMMAVAAAATSTPWRRAPARLGDGRVSVDRRLAVALVICLIVQLILGAAYRHMITAGGVDAKGASHALMAHIGMAVVVTILALFVGLRGAVVPGRDVIFRWLGRCVLVTVGLQVLLGIGGLAAVLVRPELGTTADVPVVEVLVTSAHQANGAVLLAASVVLMVWYWRASDA
jgi:cytochrome c oxidase assembly protein subunit 15